MTKEEFAALAAGDIIRHKNRSGGHALIVHANYGDHVTAARVQDCRNPAEWDLIRKAESRARGAEPSNPIRIGIDAPPRAMSTSKENPHYRSDVFKIGYMLDIWLDGRRVSRVISYDCDAGTIERHQTDRDGEYVIDRVRQKLKTEILHGVVSVTWREDGQ